MNLTPRSILPRLSAAGILILLLAASASRAADQPADAKKFESAEHKFQFTYPENWQLADPPPEGAVLKITPAESKVGKFGALLVYASPYKGAPGKPVDMKAVTAGYLRGYKNSSPDAKLVSQKETKVDGSPATELVFTRTIANTPLKARTIVTVHENEILVFTLLADNAVYDAAGPKYDEVMKSCKWIR
jgi:hypothetical protein